jgi:hypothetical protein
MPKTGESGKSRRQRTIASAPESQMLGAGRAGRRAYDDDRIERIAKRANDQARSESIVDHVKSWSNNQMAVQAGREHNAKYPPSNQPQDVRPGKPK